MILVENEVRKCFKGLRSSEELHCSVDGLLEENCFLRSIIYRF